MEADLPRIILSLQEYQALCRLLHPKDSEVQTVDCLSGDGVRLDGGDANNA